MKSAVLWGVLFQSKISIDACSVEEAVVVVEEAKIEDLFVAETVDSCT